MVNGFYAKIAAMEQQNLPVQHVEAKAPKRRRNPAQKWLYVAAAGLSICVIALLVHFTGNGSTLPDPLPKQVLTQVFGFKPYYYVDNKLPARMHLKPGSTKFFGNALIFTLVNSKNQSVIISQKILPTDYIDPQQSGNQSFISPAGTGTIGSVQGGKIAAGLITKDTTIISLESSDIFSISTIKDILSYLGPIEK
jgi:hypothetical protein